MYNDKDFEREQEGLDVQRKETPLIVAVAKAFNKKLTGSVIKPQNHATNCKPAVDTLDAVDAIHMHFTQKGFTLIHHCLDEVVSDKLDKDNTIYAHIILSEIDNENVACIYYKEHENKHQFIYVCKKNAHAHSVEIAITPCIFKALELFSMNTLSPEDDAYNIEKIHNVFKAVSIAGFDKNIRGSEMLNKVKGYPHFNQTLWQAIKRKHNDVICAYNDKNGNVVLFKRTANTVPISVKTTFNELAYIA